VQEYPRERRGHSFHELLHAGRRPSEEGAIDIAYPGGEASSTSASCFIGNRTVCIGAWQFLATGALVYTVGFGAASVPFEPPSSSSIIYCTPWCGMSVLRMFRKHVITIRISTKTRFLGFLRIKFAKFQICYFILNKTFNSPIVDKDMHSVICMVHGGGDDRRSHAHNHSWALLHHTGRNKSRMLP
jgi:hypothetical protein